MNEPKSQKYKYVVENLDKMRGWLRQGLTIEQVANNLGISKETLYQYAKINSDISVSLKEDREYADIQVENALYQEALKGNTTAIIFWLKNRKPKDWRDKVEVSNTNTNRITIFNDLPKEENND